ncbi:MAG: hypothetical protein J0H76_05080 [Sphingobacteriales bacterium]|nr:hypothetical protein [Sphingobacteriales bacterium]
MKKTLGVIMSVLFSSIFFGVLIYSSGLKAVLIALGLTILIVAAVSLCLYLLTDD